MSGEVDGDGDGDVEGAGGMGGGAGEPEGVEEDESPIYGASCPEETRGYASEVIAHDLKDDATFGQDAFPDPILGGPEGGGCCAGSLKVMSLGDGGSVTLGFGERVIRDGEGPDFLVAENPFEIGGDSDTLFAELARVEVSVDGEEFFEFPCEPGSDESGCAGKTPVLANVRKSPEVDPFDAVTAGGDAFDLADVGLETARFVRITDIAGDDAVFDLDAVTAINGLCE